MPQQPSAPVTTRHDTAEHAPRPRIGAVSLTGIGDVVDAGRPSGYAHLDARGLPTLGQVVSVAKAAAVALSRPALWPARRGRWQPAPRPARRQARGRFRVTTVALEPNSFIAGPGPRVDQGHSLEALHLVSGRAHLITSGPDGQMLSAAELSPDRVRVVGDGVRRRQHLVNTGDEVAVLVRVTV